MQTHEARFAHTRKIFPLIFSFNSTALFTLSQILSLCLGPLQPRRPQWKTVLLVNPLSKTETIHVSNNVDKIFTQYIMEQDQGDKNTKIKSRLYCIRLQINMTYILYTLMMAGGGPVIFQGPISVFIRFSSLAPLSSHIVYTSHFPDPS